MRTHFTWLPGLMLVSALAALAQVINHYSGLSSTLVAILLGFLLGNLWQVPKIFQPGINWTECQLLAVAVALLGAQLNIGMLSELKGFTLALIAAGILVTFAVTFLLGRWLRLGGTETCLLASGQGICGSAAVMATQQVIKAAPTQAGLVVALVNFLGFIGVFVLPAVAQQFLVDDPVAAGQLMGNTLQSMGHVVAAGFTAEEQVGHVAVLVKMCRIVFLIPVLLFILWFSRRRLANTGVSTEKVAWFKLIPWFIWLFLLLSLLHSLQWLPHAVQEVSTHLSQVLFLLAMVAIGLNIHIKAIWQQGGQLLLLGVLVFAVQIVFSLVLLLAQT